MSNRRTFFQYVIPSVLSFALSGVYAIVDGFFVGNSIGDAGLSAINIAYPVTAVLQAVGTDIDKHGALIRDGIDGGSAVYDTDGEGSLRFSRGAELGDIGDSASHG